MSDTQQENKTLLFTKPLEIRWGDMDAIGHVNNIIYFQYFEQARASWLDSIHYSDCISGKADTGPIIINTSATFLRPVVYPASICVNIYGGSPSRSSFMTYYTITDANDPDNIFTKGSAKVVWVDHREGKSMSIPDDVRALLPSN